MQRLTTAMQRLTAEHYSGECDLGKHASHPGLEPELVAGDLLPALTEHYSSGIAGRFTDLLLIRH